MTLSSIGRKKLAGHVVFLLVDIVVIALAARVNQFQDFFFFADIFPLALSIITLVLVVFLVLLDLALDNSFLGRPQCEIGLFGILSTLWLASNAFSTSRWRQIPFHCDSIPAEFLDEQVWCKDVQALKTFIWINFLLCFGIVLFTLRYTLTQHRQGNSHIFQMPLSRFRPELRPAEGVGIGGGFSRGSDFFQPQKLG